MNFCLSGFLFSTSRISTPDVTGPPQDFQSLSSHITVTLRFTAFLSFNFILSSQAFLWLVIHWFSLSSRSFVIIFIVGSTLFWTFLYSMTLFLTDLAVKFLFLQLVTSEHLLKTVKCLSHLRFPLGTPWHCSFVNFKMSIARFDDSCVRRILKPFLRHNLF